MARRSLRQLDIKDRKHDPRKVTSNGNVYVQDGACLRLASDLATFDSAKRLAKQTKGKAYAEVPSEPLSPGDVLFTTDELDCYAEPEMKVRKDHVVRGITVYKKFEGDSVFNDRLVRAILIPDDGIIVVSDSTLTSFEVFEQAD